MDNEYNVHAVGSNLVVSYNIVFSSTVVPAWFLDENIYTSISDFFFGVIRTAVS